jgi:hypothetical protein
MTKIKKKTVDEEIVAYLLSQGAHEITEEEALLPKYKKTIEDCRRIVEEHKYD